jgi:hypothetical protein
MTYELVFHCSVRRLSTLPHPHRHVSSYIGQLLTCPSQHMLKCSVRKGTFHVGVNQSLSDRRCPTMVMVLIPLNLLTDPCHCSRNLSIVLHVTSRSSRRKVYCSFSHAVFACQWQCLQTRYEVAMLSACFVKQLWETALKLAVVQARPVDVRCRLGCTPRSYK